MQQMRQEEDRAIADYARRKSQEEESLRLAMQLQAQEEQYAMQQQQLSLAQQQSAVSQRAAQQQVRRKRVVVPLPPNASPGQVLRVQVPGHGLMSVQVPQGATPGQALEFYVAPPQQMEVKKVRVVLPQNAVPGQNITVKVPGVGTHVTVKVPQGANPWQHGRIYGSSSNECSRRRCCAANGSERKARISSIVTRGYTQRNSRG